MKEITKRWLEFAKADMDAAGVQLRHGKQRGSAYQVVVFHCHQAIEKILKAYLIEENHEIKKIHDVITLRTLAKIEIPENYQKYIDELHPHYLIPRYPDLPFAPTFSFTYNQKNVRQIYRNTKKVFIWLTKKLTQKK